MLPKWATHPAGGTMVIMLLSGTAFIIGHHFFYQSLSGKPPPNVVYFSGFAGGLSGQQVNLAAGLAFAFFASSALGVLITTAANQALWVAVRTKPSKLEVIDNLATATTNIWNMFDFRLWKSSPIRMTLVTIFWLLSVTSFITPATLIIKWSITTSVVMTRVPQVDFTSLNFAELHFWPSLSPVYAYRNPQYPVLKVVAESMVGSRILPISSPYQNATWLLKFPGPALSCESIDNSSILYKNITNNILVAGEKYQDYSFNYISWVPKVLSDYYSPQISSLPFPNILLNDNNTKYEPPSQTLGPILPWGASLTLLIAALPGMLNSSSNGYRQDFDRIANMTVTRCMMYNTSYVANFTYIDNIQSINVTTQGSFNNITAQDAVAGAVMLHYMDTFAYQAIMDAFGRMLVGSIVFDYSSEGQIIDTQIALTPLLDTKELNFLRPLSKRNTLEELTGQVSGIWNGISVQQVSNPTVLLADMIEEMFRNVTLSLISNPLLQPNYSSPYAPPDIDVAVTTYALVYSYAAQTLWLAYGIALGMTLFSLLLGAISIYHNGGASYTTKFSTILRAAYCIDFSEPIRPEDTDGKDPTPRYIKKLTIYFPPVGKTVHYDKAAQISEEEEP
ncbi:hypothetical protein TRIATDRAFT_93783 [Trichoderma atroviride IMI 206040]|uniref:Uncharacterized protein n=1 Tax=Hypocrea atroviridis (strain ATCC 20476 / IMI 206040) TaxID=452589 RepID=G9NLL9_HYPAI|nr:uncharacterized protein TRIATDRAFT_93783 [Trichoderma atroviride IMI 206040]EHK48781.1 hypothetical protein TRIATDRAFT_93783 [Trichoderma atroviride IMI 206040]